MIFSLLIGLASLLHPIHLSVTEINHSEKDKALQITSRIFIDDLELSIQKDIKEDALDLLKPENGKTIDQLVANYVLKHLKVKVDGKAQTLKYLGHEIEDLALTCYIEISNIKKLKSIEVFNDVLMETHRDQSNLVHLSYLGKMKSVRLVGEKSNETIMF